MTTYTIYSATSDGKITSSSTTYSSARSGTGLSANNSSTTMEVGQQRGGSTRFCYEGFVTFDCSSITGSASSATLNLNADFDVSTTNFTTNARTHSWSGSGLTTADWVAGASLSALTLLASFASASYPGDGNYAAFTSDAALLTAVDLHGTLDMLLCSDRHEAGNDPIVNEYIRWASADATGTSLDPYLEVIVSSDTPGARLTLGPKIERMRLVA